MLRLMRIMVVLAAILLGTYCTLATENDGSSARAKRYVNFNLLKPYMPNFKDDPFERPIVLETRDARNRLDCILNLRSFELCRERI
ncbi:hypothetical protein ANCCAN_18691 [Ancylostoma caninum]|uniref:Uncharacterized protein n=1 Tax=Ancylostoma caninum TaxID=29170 RepID=A0A368FTM6_ANCCA|nr:hypothetical protein ANCCAN_18691 [Ancylostoma caninum]